MIQNKLYRLLSKAFRICKKHYADNDKLYDALDEALYQIEKMEGE
jgi:RNAse (barnase) inhibitor barstar